MMLHSSRLVVGCVCFWLLWRRRWLQLAGIDNLLSECSVQWEYVTNSKSSERISQSNCSSFCLLVAYADNNQSKRNLCQSNGRARAKASDERATSCSSVVSPLVSLVSKTLVILIPICSLVLSQIGIFSSFFV